MQNVTISLFLKLFFISLMHNLDMLKVIQYFLLSFYYNSISKYLCFCVPSKGFLICEDLADRKHGYFWIQCN